MTTKPTTPPRILAGSETTLPVLPLRDVVVFPHMVIPLFVGRRKSIRALERAMESGKQIMLVAQKSASDDDPSIEAIHTLGTIAGILQLLKLPDGTVKVLVEGERRAVVQRYVETEELFSAEVALLDSEALPDREGEALMRTVLNEFDQYVKLNMKIPPEIATAGMPKDVRAKADAELNKLKMMSPMSAEATVVRNYIDWLVNVPWRKRSKIRKDLTEAEKILEHDHYGLEKVKERILEYLAV